MKIQILTRLSLLIILIPFLNFKGQSQENNRRALAAADTSNFSVNKNEGWDLYNSHVSANGPDSIDLEIIVQHRNNLNWAEEQYIGRIKTASLIPKVEQNVSFSLIVTVFGLRINPAGNCYLRLISGVSPQQSLVVVPAKVIYRKYR